MVVVGHERRRVTGSDQRVPSLRLGIVLKMRVPLEPGSAQNVAPTGLFTNDFFKRIAY